MRKYTKRDEQKAAQLDKLSDLASRYSDYARIAEKYTSPQGSIPGMPEDNFPQKLSAVMRELSIFSLLPRPYPRTQNNPDLVKAFNAAQAACAKMTPPNPYSAEASCKKASLAALTLAKSLLSNDPAEDIYTRAVETTEACRESAALIGSKPTLGKFRHELDPYETLLLFGGDAVSLHGSALACKKQRNLAIRELTSIYSDLEQELEDMRPFLFEKTFRNSSK